MLIQQKDNAQQGSFYIKDGDTVTAEMDYIWKGQLMVVVHTEVDNSLAGKGIGKQLVQHAVEYAREKQIKIHPVCSFAKAVFEKVKDYQDVLKQ